MSTNRQIVIQKQKQQYKRKAPDFSCYNTQNSQTLVRSLKSHINQPGFIYSDKKDNLVVSRDILYDRNDAFKRNDRQAASYKNPDASKHTALKELLNNNLAFHGGQGLGYRNRFDGPQSQRPKPEKSNLLMNKSFDQQQQQLQNYSNHNNYSAESRSTSRTAVVNDFARNSSIPWQAKSYQTAYGSMRRSVN